jgi:putative CocE/NonD family hydrolase
VSASGETPRRTFLVEKDIRVAAGGGVTLATDVYRPADEAPHPCLVQRVPYGKDHPGIANIALDVLAAVDRGYAVVVQECRGRFRSGGTFEPFVHERADGLATIDWVSGREWCDGHIGMFGRSYSAMAQWLLADADVPELKALAPTFSGSDIRRGWLAPGGAFEWGFALLWFLRHLAPDVVGRQGEAAVVAELLDLVGDLPTLYRDLSPDAARWIDRHLPFAAPLLDPRRRDEALRVLDGMSVDPADVKVPVLVVAGWFDLFLQGSLETYERLRGDAALVVGPWPHGGAPSGVFPERSFGPGAGADAIGLTAIQLDWFDRWLRTPRQRQREERRVLAFEMGIDKWRGDECWPPRDGVLREFALSDGGALVEGVGAEGVDVLAYDEDDPVPTVGGQTFLPGLEVAANAGPRDQRDLLGRPDVAVYVTPPLRMPTTLAGSVELDLYLADVVPGMRVVGRALDVSPDGAAMLLIEGAASTPPADGAAVRVQVRIGSTGYRLAAGHRLGILVTHTSFPRFERRVGPVDTGYPAAGATRILRGPGHPSAVRLAARRD